MPPEERPELTDEACVEALRNGDRGAADALARKYWPAIQRFCANYIGDAQLGEDVAQETFSRLVSGAELPEGPLRPWLYRVARNRCLDILRRHQRSPTHGHAIRTGFDSPTQTGGPRTRADRSERRLLIRQIIDQMPDDYREVLLLKFFEGLSRAEMAAALDLSEQAVKGRLARASDALSEELRRLTGVGL